MRGRGAFNEFGEALVENDFTIAPTKGTLPPIRAQLIGSSRCSAGGNTAFGPAPVLTLCRRLVAAGLDPNRRLEVYRGGTLALFVSFNVIGHGLGWRVQDCGVGNKLLTLGRRSRQIALGVRDCLAEWALLKPPASPSASPLSGELSGHQAAIAECPRYTP